MPEASLFGTDLSSLDGTISDLSHHQVLLPYNQSVGLQKLQCPTRVRPLFIGVGDCQACAALRGPPACEFKHQGERFRNHQRSLLEIHARNGPLYKRTPFAILPEADVQEICEQVFGLPHRTAAGGTP